MVEAFLNNIAIDGLAEEILQARTWHHADGAVEPGRSSRTRHRQQERARRRVLDAVRRCCWWFRTAQGRLKDAGVATARWRNKSAEERAEIPPIPESHQQAAECSFAQASWTPIRCRRTSCSTTCSTTTSSRIAALVTSSHQDSTRTWSSACSAWSTRRSTSGVSTPGTEDLAARVRTRSAAADHQPVARASAATHGRGAAERLSASSAGRPERCRRCAHIADDWMPVWCRPSRPCCAGGARGRRA